jgi:hypothetical protein
VKVILAEDLDDVGRKGDVVTVADGYARNFLVPKGIAIIASKGALRQAEQMRKAREEQEDIWDIVWELRGFMLHIVLTVAALAAGLTSDRDRRELRTGSDGRRFDRTSRTESPQPPSQVDLPGPR